MEILPIVQLCGFVNAGRGNQMKTNEFYMSK